MSQTITPTETTFIAQFDLGEAGTAKDKIVSGKVPVIFKAGDYPDKKFAINVAEMKAGVKDVTSLKIGLSHVPTVLDGKLGEIGKFSVSKDGVLSGERNIPEWLEHNLDATKRKLSAVWDIAKKKLIGIDLVPFPRIAEAGFSIDPVVAAFANEMGMSPTDPALSAVPGDSGPDHGDSFFTSVKDMAQKLLDSADPKVMKPKYIKRLQKYIDLADKDLASDEGEETPEEKKAEETPVAQYSADNLPPEVAARFAKMEADNKTLAGRLKSEENKRIAVEAAAFADTEISSCRAYPAEKDTIIADFVQRANDDIAQFSADDKAGTRVANLKAMFAARPPHKLTQEMIQANPSNRILKASFDTPNPSAEKPMTPEIRRQRLMETPLGQQILAEEAAVANKNGQLTK